MNIVEATRSYEAWLGKVVPLVRNDLNLKHRLMEKSALSLLRGTYYRWLGLWPQICPELAAGPRVLSVGDLHLENFGTWRDGEGRLVWGINDFDEAHACAYANDLVRLAASVLVATQEDSLTLNGKKACADILEGYRAVIGGGRPVPFVLEEHNDALRALALSEERSPRKFWEKLTAGKKAAPPAAAAALLRGQFPKETKNISFAARTAGTGSLGVPRYVAFGSVAESFIAREAKMRTPGANAWASGTKGPKPADHQILKQAVRAPDPFLVVAEDWILRRLAPHCERIEIPAIADAKAQREVLHAMGRETANVHWGDRAAAARIVKDLAVRKPSWLYRAARDMADATFKDWKAWRKRT